MGAFAGACLLAMAGAFIASEIYGNFEGAAAMGGGTLGAFAGAIAGAIVALWLILRRGGQHGGTAVVAATGLAGMLVVCFAIVAFSG
jgi:peptidoglycan/LPS O-acetylase OafA/YrhL